MKFIFGILIFISQITLATENCFIIENMRITFVLRLLVNNCIVNNIKETINTVESRWRRSLRSQLLETTTPLSR